MQDVLSLEAGQPPAGQLAYGCETRETNLIFDQSADGLFALGNSSSAAIAQLAAAGVVAPVFSLCFGGVDGAGGMLLGDAPLPAGAALQYTPFLWNPAYLTPTYTVGLQGMAVGGQPLGLDPVSGATWEGERCAAGLVRGLGWGCSTERCSSLTKPCARPVALHPPTPPPPPAGGLSAGLRRATRLWHNLHVPPRGGL